MQYIDITNPIFLSILLSVLAAQGIKTLLDILEHKRFDWRWLFRGAGMPSSHTATVTSMALAVYISEGFTTLFIVAATVAIIVIRDVIGDKVFATHQENLINKFIQQLIHHEKVQWNHLIGHTLVEVFAGLILATAITLVVFFL
jgi:acid phosphatase family membrane protein YuiD